MIQKNMTDIRFYHMQQKRLEQALPEILAKVLERGMRAVIKLGSRERLDAMDSVLWTHDPAGFLPHGFAKDGSEGDQPLWLTTEEENPNGAVVLILADGAVSDRVGEYQMCCEFFDGNDEEAVAAARGRWKEYKDGGHDLSYYQQDDNGRWEKKAS